MTKPVVGLTVFGSNTSGTTTQLDNNFSALQDAANDFNTYKNYLTDSGSANALSVALPANITGALADGLPIQVRVAATNTGATVINYNGTGNANVLNMDGSALAAGAVAANAIILMQYSNAAAAWYLQTPVSAASAGGSLVLISNKQANANATIDFNASISSTYDNYKLVISNVVPQNQNVSLLLRVAESGANYKAGTGDYAWTSYSASDGSSPAAAGSNNNANAIQIQNVLGNSVNDSFGADITLMGLACTTQYKMVIVDSVNRNANFAFNISRGAGAGEYKNSNAALVAIQVLASSGNITSGNFALYGMRKS